jgi:hypothetical protein
MVRRCADGMSEAYCKTWSTETMRPVDWRWTEGRFGAAGVSRESVTCGRQVSTVNSTAIVWDTRDGVVN